MAATVAAFALWRGFGSAAASGGIPEGDPRRIAVLYLDVLTPETVAPHVADGLTEDLIDRLGEVDALHVISPNGVRPYRGQSIAVDSIGRALKVGTIVGGSVARSGSTLRVNVRLVDAATGRQLESETVDENWTDLFSLQDKLTERVAFVLRQRVGDAVALREHRRSTGSFVAWEHVQRAGAEARLATQLAQRNDPQSALLFLRADSLYGQAQQADPDWILPIVRRGRIAMALALVPPGPPTSLDAARYDRMPALEKSRLWVQYALVLADSAVSHSPRSGEALTLRGDVRYRLATIGSAGSDSLLALAEQDLRRAVDAAPTDAPGWAALAQVWTLQGRYLEAASAARRAFEADAFFEVRRTISTALTASLFAEQYDDAIRWCRLGLSHYAADPRFTQCALVVLGWSGRRHTDVDSAWRVVTSVERYDTLSLLAPTWMYRRILVGAILARAGLADSARQLLTAVQQRELDEPNNRSAAIGKAYVRLLLGDRDRALADLTTYVNASPGARSQLRTHPWFRPLWADRRFTALVQPTPQ